LSELLTRGNQLLNDADGMLKEVGGRLNGALGAVTTAISNVNDVVGGVKQGRGTAGMLLRDEALSDRIRQTITTTSSDVQEIVADVKAGRGPAGMLLRNEALAAQIRETVKNAQQSATDLGHAARQADSLATDMNSRQISLKTSDLLDSLNSSARQLDGLITDIGKPDGDGMSAGVNLRASLTNASTAASNLADATEALKHNFLTRGFFKKRGYYSLADLSPETYRREKAFTNPANRRVWLSGSDLFETARDGNEQLSASGKAILNDALAEYGEPGIKGPIIIEGYWNGGVPADELRLSRSRAVIVRQYLQTHFHLDPRDLGSVPMKNSPLTELRRATWDGVHRRSKANLST
jgi:phospholipid/cholesterol/gamma-HCH transport system substrate-binding protein